MGKLRQNSLFDLISLGNPCHNLWKSCKSFRKKIPFPSNSIFQNLKKLHPFLSSDKMAGSLVVGLGAGVVILLVVWTLVLVAWVQLSTQQSRLRALITIFSILLTVILLLIPTADELGAEEERPTAATHPDLISPLEAFEVYDYMFIWKGILMGLMSLGILSALGVYLKEFWSLKVHGSLPVPTKKISADDQYQ